MSKNLRNCPFCGCKDINLSFIFPDEEDEGWKIAYARECDQCHATTSWFTKEEEADEAWNRRADKGRETCREVYLLMATDIGNGRDEVLGVYATEEAAMAAINENQFGYAFHHVRKCEVDE